MNPLEALVGALCRSLPRGGGRLIGALGAFYRSGALRPVTVGELSLTVDPRISFERLMLFRCYEHRLIRFARSLLRPGDVVIDAGAHIGWLSLHFLDAVTRSGAVHSFEPVPDHFARLDKAANDARQRGFRWSAVRSALGDRSGTATLSLGNDVNPLFNTLIPEFTRDGLRKGTVEVPLMRLDDYLETQGIERVRLLKIDTEGAEGMVLRGTSAALKAGRIRSLIVEISPQAEQAAGRERGETIRFLRDLGYAGRLLERGRLRPLPEHFDFWVADTYWTAPE